MADTGYVFNGVQNVEAQDRENEERSGVPATGGMALLLRAPIKRSSMVKAQNVGEEACLLRMRHGASEKTQTNENITAFAVGGNRYVGTLQFKSIKKGSVSITNAGAPVTVVDDSAGGLYDTGFVGIAANKRGTIDYVKGLIDLTFGGAPTEPVRATYKHNDYIDFLSPAQTTTKAAAAYPFTMALGFGRVAPGTVAISEGTPLTFIDDGKGNIIETTAGGIAKRGTIDYATGIITLTAGSAALGGTVTATFNFNPFAAFVAAGGSAKVMDMFSNIPEFSSAPFAAGVKGQTYLGLFGESRGNKGSALIVQWYHYSEEPFRVEAVFSGFPAGGQSNDPNAN